MESYKSVKLEAVAAAFGVSAEFMDAELADFIVAGRLSAKIDKVAGVVETNRRDLSPPRQSFTFLGLCIRVSASCTVRSSLWYKIRTLASPETLRIPRRLHPWCLL